MDNNEFSGKIPELKLPNLEQFNVSVIKGQENDALGEKPIVEGAEIRGTGAVNGGNEFSVASAATAAAMNDGNGKGESGGSVGKIF